MKLDGNIRLTPRVWMTRSTLDVDDFTDVVDSRVLVGNASRFTGGLGVIAETARARNWRGGALSPARIGGPRADPRRGGDECRRFGREAFFRVSQDPRATGSGRGRIARDASRWGRKSQRAVSVRATRSIRAGSLSGGVSRRGHEVVQMQSPGGLALPLPIGFNPKGCFAKRPFDTRRATMRNGT